MMMMVTEPLGVIFSPPPFLPLSLDAAAAGWVGMGEWTMKMSYVCLSTSKNRDIEKGGLTLLKNSEQIKFDFGELNQ